MATNTFPGRNPFGSSNAGMGNVPEEDEMQTSPTAATFGQNIFNSQGGFGGGPASYADGQRSALAPPEQGFPNQYEMGRRTSVSAESMDPANSAGDNNWKPPVHQKSEEQKERIRTAVKNNFLFSHLASEQEEQILGALFEKPIPAKGIKVISQGDVGDNFYIVETGQFDVYINKAGSVQPGVDGNGEKVATVGPGGSFGELALMYNAPRAATVVSTQDKSLLWALDRVTFKRILMDAAFQRRRMYEQFLNSVPLLSNLTEYERAKIADALETTSYQAGEIIIKEGDIGDRFFLLEEGEAKAFIGSVENGDAVKTYKLGDYFGELALLDDKPRAASIVASTSAKAAWLGKEGFRRLLGPVEDRMRAQDYRSGETVS